VYYYNKYLNDEIEESIGCGTCKSDSHLINDIINVIIKEAQLYKFYQSLNDLTQNFKYKRIISNIQKDELKHFKWANMLISKMGGEKTQIPEGEIPTDFKCGLKIAIKNKLEMSTYYRNIAKRATNISIFIYFTHMAYEEHRHKSCLEYMLYDLK